MTAILEVFDPTVDPIPAHGVVAQRPRTLNGVALGLLANGKPNADLLLRMVHDVLADQFEFKTVVVRNKWNASRPCPPEIIQELADQCDVVITGNGD